MKKSVTIIASMMLLMSANTAFADSHNDALVVTASNAVAGNQLMVYDTSGNLLQTLSTQGLGGVGGNSGGVETEGNVVAVVNFGSQSVSIFRHQGNGLVFVQKFATDSKPVSVAFGHDHLYVLGDTSIESHKVFGSIVDPNADGTATLVKADNSAAQVGVLPNELIITEKSNTVESVNLDNGAVSGTASAVTIPAGSDTPLGLITRGNTAYVTIAHSDEVSVIKHDQVTDIASSGTEHAPCWLALVGRYLYSSNTPSKSVSIYKVTGDSISLDVPVAATFTGGPTDIASDDRMVAVIDGSHTLSVFKVGAHGALTLVSAANTGVATNGVAIVD